MRVKRLTYQSEASPFGLWTLPASVDDPSFAPCYAPYGESFPPISSRPAPRQNTLDQMMVVKSKGTDSLKPWEKGSKTGKKIKKGRGPKVRIGMDPASDVGSNEMSSHSSSNSSFENNSSVSSNVSSVATTWIQSSLQSSPASRTGQYPVLDVAQYGSRPTAPVLHRPTFHHSYHPDTAQVAIALSRSKSIDLESKI